MGSTLSIRWPWTNASQPDVSRDEKIYKDVPVIVIVIGVRSTEKAIETEGPRASALLRRAIEEMSPPVQSFVRIGTMTRAQGKGLTT